jgi:hypothetical protein
MIIKLHPDLLGRRNRTDGYVAYNRGGRSFLRTFVVPGNPQTVYQQVVRGSMAQASAVWATLTGEVRASYEDLASAYYANQVDIDGNNYSLTGQQLCNSVQFHRLMAAQAVSTAALTTTPPVVTQPIYCAINNTSPTSDITVVQPQPIPESIVRLRITSTVLEGYAVPKNLYRSPFLSIVGVIGSDYTDNAGASAPLVWSTGDTGDELKSFVADISNGDIIGCEVLNLSTEYLPCPSGPQRVVTNCVVTS